MRIWSKVLLALCWLLWLPDDLRAQEPNEEKPTDEGGEASSKISTENSGALPEDEIIALVNGKPLALSEVDRLIRPQLMKLYDEIYMRLKALDRAITDTLFAEEAQRRGLSFEEFYQSLLEDARVPEEELERMESAYPGGHLLLDKVEALERYRANQLQRSKAEILQRQKEDLRKDAKVRVFLRPDRSVNVDVDADDDPARGPPDAPVTIIEFADYRCPHCKRMRPVLEAVLEEFAGHLRLVFRDFPINDNPQSLQAAQAAECARDQARFWEYHDLLLDHDGKLSLEALQGYADQAGIQAQPFTECLQSGKYSLEVRKDKADGKAAGVSGTPSFFINGHFLSGSIQLEALREIVRQEIARDAPENRKEIK